MESDSLGSDNDEEVMSSEEDESNEEAPLFAENSSNKSIQNPSSGSSRQKPQLKKAPKWTSWGIHKHKYSFLNNLSNEKNMRSNVSDILSRINPRRFLSTQKSKLSGSSGSDSDEMDEDLIDF